VTSARQALFLRRALGGIGGIANYRTRPGRSQVVPVRRTLRCREGEQQSSNLRSEPGEAAHEMTSSMMGCQASRTSRGRTRSGHRSTSSARRRCRGCRPACLRGGRPRSTEPGGADRSVGRRHRSRPVEPERQGDLCERPPDRESPQAISNEDRPSASEWNLAEGDVRLGRGCGRSGAGDVGPGDWGHDPRVLGLKWAGSPDASTTSRGWQLGGERQIA
jgi:hypothetical protein